MPNVSAQIRFLLRGWVLLIFILGLWWMTPLHPLWVLFRILIDVPAHWFPGVPTGSAVRVLPDGDWSLLVRRTAEVRLPASGLVAISLGMPIFCAVVLAAPGRLQRWRVLIRGLSVLTLLAVAQLYIFVAGAVNMSMHVIANPIVARSLGYGYYLAVFMMPFTAPFVVALWLDRDFRALVFKRDLTVPASYADPRKSEAIPK